MKNYYGKKIVDLRDFEKPASFDPEASRRSINKEFFKSDEIVYLGRRFESDGRPVYYEYDNYKKEEPPLLAKAPRPKKQKLDVFNFRFLGATFAFVAIFILIFIGGVTLVSRGFNLKGRVLGVGEEGYQNLSSAVSEVLSQDFQTSAANFQNAYEKFSSASIDMEKMGGALIDMTKYLPYFSRLSSGKNMLEAGKHVSLAGKSLSLIGSEIYETKNLKGRSDSDNFSFLELFQSIEKNMVVIRKELEEAENNLNQVKVDDLPRDKQKEFMELKKKLPVILKSISAFLDNSHIFVDLLGGNGPRKYLFLFQNNQEMRATGGFIGSYGLLDINNGRVRNFFIDGIFNPDGQLAEKIIPPEPIQKVSAAWSLHDSNWFPDFPRSAEKAILFYEKTGGPTTDGIITLTPTIMERLLEITGPIEMPEYGLTLDSNNFIEKTQYETEVDYDKEANNPKKILSDLAPIVLDRIFNAEDVKDIYQSVDAISQGLEEKQILLYFRNSDLEEIISRLGWSGEILPSSSDYLAVINTNINGYKTDGVIEEKIEHLAQIENDGSIIDTVTITRHHTGGDKAYSWWNKVNADYMRVYAPLGAELLEVSGQTRELNEPPLDYKALGFRTDPDVEKEKESMKIEEASGTRIYEDAGKTVFANWAYVSPQETVAVKYKYRLPFKITLGEREKADSYSLLAQKQSGSSGSHFISKIIFSAGFEAYWKSDGLDEKKKNELVREGELTRDIFQGVIFTSAP